MKLLFYFGLILLLLINNNIFGELNPINNETIQLNKSNKFNYKKSPNCK
jgi:hypothetical protein